MATVFPEMSFFPSSGCCSRLLRRVAEAGEIVAFFERGCVCAESCVVGRGGRWGERRAGACVCSLSRDGSREMSEAVGRATDEKSENEADSGEFVAV